MPQASVGKPLSFTFSVGKESETLSITPLGVGVLTADAPEMVFVPLGESRQITIHLLNSGTQAVEKISVKGASTTYGVEFSNADSIALSVSERREFPVIVSVASDAPIGLHKETLIISSSSGSQTVSLQLEILPNQMRLAMLSGLTVPSLILLGVIMILYCGMKLQEFRHQRAQESAKDYELQPTHRAGD